MCTDGTITFLVDINLMYNPTLQQTNKTTSHRKTRLYIRKGIALPRTAWNRNKKQNQML